MKSFIKLQHVISLNLAVEPPKSVKKQRYYSLLTHSSRVTHLGFFTLSCQDDRGYPHDGRRADKDSYPHDSNNQCIILKLRDD